MGVLIMKNPKKVTKLEKRNGLVQTLYYNTLALDYIENEINRYDNFVKYNEEDMQSLNTLNVLKYIQFSLKYLDDMYNKSIMLLEACND